MYVCHSNVKPYTPHLCIKNPPNVLKLSLPQMRFLVRIFFVVNRGPTSRTSVIVAAFFCVETVARSSLINFHYASWLTFSVALMRQSHETMLWTNADHECSPFLWIFTTFINIHQWTPSVQLSATACHDRIDHRFMTSNELLHIERLMVTLRVINDRVMYKKSV